MVLDAAARLVTDVASEVASTDGRTVLGSSGFCSTSKLMSGDGRVSTSMLTAGEAHGEIGSSSAWDSSDNSVSIERDTTEVTRYQ